MARGQKAQQSPVAEFPHELSPEQTQTRRYISFDAFDTMDTQPARVALDKKRLAWLENAMILAHNQLSVLPGPSNVALQTLTGETISRMFFSFINGVDYAICFCVSGAAYGVNLANGVATKFANAGTFSSKPDATTWADQALLMADATGGYCAWTGSVFAKPGTASPNFDVLQGGNGYTGAPTVIITGGGGQNAFATATLSGDQVTKLTATNLGTGFAQTDVLGIFFRGGNPNPAKVIGFQILDGGSNYTSAPTVTFASFPGDPGTGATATAQVTGGVLTNITITNSGQGYLATPGMSVDGGGGVTNATSNSPPTVVGGAITVIPITTGGSNYKFPPMVYIVGDGNGAFATATLTGGSVTGITIVNGGSGYTAANTKVVFQGGGGAIVMPLLDNVAAARTQVWPVVPSCTTLAVFQGRVWLASGRLLTYSGTTGFSDFSPANASGATLITDPDLVHSVTALRALNNFLFIFGDNSIKQIGSVTVANSLTNFSIVTLSSDNGTSFPMSIVSYNRLVLFNNTQGIFAIFGASVEKISDPMDGIFRAIDFTQEPVAVVDDLFNLHTYQLLVRYNDPTRGQISLILIFQQKRWCVANQGANVRSMVAAPTVGNPNHQTIPYMTSGNDITAMFTDSITSQNVIVQTALTFDGQPLLNKRATRMGIAQSVATLGGTVNLSLDTENGSNPISVTVQNVYQWLNANSSNYQWQIAGPQNYNWVILSSGFHYLYTGITGSGIYLGATISGSFNGVTLHAIGIEYSTGALFASNNLR